MEIRSILCPTDFSEFSRCALAHAIRLAGSCGAELTIVHVYPFIGVVATDVPYIPSGLPLDASTRARLLSDLEAFAEPARTAGVTTSVLLLEGDPSEELLRRARTTRPDLLVIGTHGRRGFDRFMLGSVAGRVVERAPCAVLTVPRPKEPGRPAGAGFFDEILCAVDLCGSEATFEAALSIAAAEKGRVTFLHVLDSIQQFEWLAGMAHADWLELQARLEREGRAGLHQAVMNQGADPSRVGELVVMGKAYREILNVADTTGAGLIVLGIHGRSVLDRAFFGSTALHVVRGARCPVLTVRSPEGGTS